MQANTSTQSITNPKRDLVVVVPTLNEKAGIREVLSFLAAKLKGYTYEVIAVDGGSRNETVQIAKNLGA